jgi:hypothetical protein
MALYELSSDSLWRKVNPAEIRHKLTYTVYSRDAVTCKYVWLCDCCIKFPEGYREVLNLLYAHIQSATRYDVNICHNKELMEGKEANCSEILHPAVA